MICKIVQGGGFGGAIDYVMSKDGAELLDAKDVRSNDPKLVAKDFEMISNQNKRVKKPVVHFSVSFHKDDAVKITNDKMKAIANKLIDGMGFSNAQYIVVKHTDAAHPHFHIVTSKVDLDINTISDKHNFLKLNKLRVEIEKEYPELTSAGGKNMESTNTKNLKGKDAVKYKIYIAIKIEIQKSINIEALLKNLEQTHGIKSELKFRRGSIDVIEGVKFHKDNTWISGSKIDKSCSYLNLLKQLNENKLNNKSPNVNTTKPSTKPLTNPNKNILANMLSKIPHQHTENTNGVKKRNKTNEEELER